MKKDHQRTFLAAGLPQNLFYPQALDGLRGLPPDEQLHLLLSACGLDDQQCRYFAYRWAHPSGQRPFFEAIPRNARLSVSPQNLEHSSFGSTPDIAELGIFHFYTRVTFGVKERDLLKDFRKWVRAQSEAFGFPRRDRKVALLVLVRDVLIFTLRTEAKWEAKHIQQQVASLSLPEIGGKRSPSTTIAVVRRQVGRKISDALNRRLAKEFD